MRSQPPRPSLPDALPTSPALPASLTPAAPPLSPARRLLRDPRHYQILVLGSLLAYGLLRLDLEVRAGQALAIAAAALATQFAGTRWLALRRRGQGGLAASDLEKGGLAAAELEEGGLAAACPRFDPKSACISALSLCLLGKPRDWGRCAVWLGAVPPSAGPNAAKTPDRFFRQPAPPGHYIP